MAKNARVYSYLRFSDAKQSAGSSADRQTQYAAKWAKERGLTLDETLSLRDEGLSAFHQHHVKQGALGTFLRAVDDGRIPHGSVLVVEGLDRLSRAEPNHIFDAATRTLEPPSALCGRSAGRSGTH